MEFEWCDATFFFFFFAVPHSLHDLSSPDQGLNLGCSRILTISPPGNSSPFSFYLTHEVAGSNTLSDVSIATSKEI